MITKGFVIFASQGFLIRVLSKVGIFFRHVILFLNQPNDERYRTKYVPGAEIAAFVNIDTDKFEERFNAQCIQY